MSSGESRTEWGVQDLFPDKSPVEAGNEAADFFSKISNTFQPINESRTLHAGETRTPLTESEVAGWLKKAKKPSSAVRGDVLPRLMKAHHESFVFPVQRIFNAILATERWPKKWKEETTVIIPKTTCPKSLAECRNISCTHFLSKVMESVLLNDLRSEIPQDPAQYGGLKGSSVDHLLIELHERVLGAVDEGQSAVVLGIDFEKAFNRLDHTECLKQLSNLGASSTTIRLVRTFLTWRSMRVKIGTHLSDPKQLNGGSPQGSILGSYLYCATTQHMGAELPPPPLGSPAQGEAPPQSLRTSDTDEDEDGFEVLNWAADISEGDSESEDEAVSPEAPQLSPGSPSNDEGSIEGFKYIDDTTLVEVVPRGREIRHISSTRPTKRIPAKKTTRAMTAIKRRAEDIGMRVNCGKTQLVTFSPSDGYSHSAGLNIDGEEIPSQPSMKLLGYMLGPDVAVQVSHLKGKFRKRFWNLVNLRKAGLKGDRLYKLYCTLIRPVLETNAVVFHPMLSKAQSGDLERLQALVVRLCYGRGWAPVYESQDPRTSTLAARRENAVRKLTAKIMQPGNIHGTKWLNRRQDIEPNLRTRRPFIGKQGRKNTGKAHY